jgi:hypothetical protein
MAIIDRVKERIETDLSDTELQLLIDEANQDVINRYGANSDPSSPITVSMSGLRKKLVLDRPVDVSEPVVINEYISWFGEGEQPYTLTDSDYRILPPFYNVVERLFFGTSTTPRWHWPERVELTYVPISDNNSREEVMIKMVILAIQYDGLNQVKVGDYSAQSNDYQTERNMIMSTLDPRHGSGLYMQ